MESKESRILEMVKILGIEEFAKEHGGLKDWEQVFNRKIDDKVKISLVFNDGYTFNFKLPYFIGSESE